ncbi:MAG: acylphosphatase, partial [Planctomycetaceae bacterium]|nr:acylphosphatase [Planctomycetaceae bacterium]
MSANPTRSSVNPKATASIIARRVLLRGQVQGIGMRPAVAKLALRLKVWGSVCNRNSGLEIVVEGKPDQVHGFLNQLSAALPAAAQITSAEVSGCVPRGLNTFEIVRETSHDVLDAVVPLDRAVCGHCLQEYADENDPRGGYPHISCTECGPRYSIIQEMPFERDQTSLAKFPLCEDCQRDYQDFENRRVHAQTIGCAKCGPSVWYQQGNEIVEDYRQSLNRAVELLQKGMILGLCGLGGYQL